MIFRYVKNMEYIKMTLDEKLVAEEDDFLNLF